MSGQAETSLLQELLDEWGYVMNATGLRKALGFRSSNVLRTAISENRVPFKTFKIAGRRGPYALTADVAKWLASLSVGEG